MKLTHLEKLMIVCLKEYGATEDEMLGIMMMLNTEEKRAQMEIWMTNHTTADMGEVTEAAHKIYLEK